MKKIIRALAFALIPALARAQYNTPAAGGGAGLSANNAFTGSNTFGKLNSIRIVDGVSFTTIQAAINDAGTTGTVLIPPGYAGTDTYTNANNVPILDFRNTQGLPGAIGIWSPITSAIPGLATFPLGNDLALWHMGPADLRLYGSLLSATTTATLSVGANTNVLIGSVTNASSVSGTLKTGNSSLLAQVANQSLSVKTGTGTPDSLTWTSTSGCPTASTWNVVDATHLCLNVPNSHTGTTTISQGPGEIGGDDIAVVNIRGRQDSDFAVNLDSGTGAAIRGTTINLEDNGAAKWAIAKTTANNFAITNPGVLNRLQLTPGGVSDLSSEGTSPVRVNAIATGSTGTGGLEVWNGGATPAKLVSINATGLTFVNAGGTALSRYARYAVVLSPVAVSANTCAAQSFTVTGIAAADILVAVNKPSEQAGLFTGPGHVTGANTATINFCNVTGLSITPTASETYQFIAVQ